LEDNDSTHPRRRLHERLQFQIGLAWTQHDWSVCVQARHCRSSFFVPVHLCAFYARSSSCVLSLPSSRFKLKQIGSNMGSETVQSVDEIDKPSQKAKSLSGALAQECPRSEQGSIESRRRFNLERTCALSCILLYEMQHLRPLRLRSLSFGRNTVCSRNLSPFPTVPHCLLICILTIRPDCSPGRGHTSSYTYRSPAINQSPGPSPSVWAATTARIVTVCCQKMHRMLCTHVT